MFTVSILDGIIMFSLFSIIVSVLFLAIVWLAYIIQMEIEHHRSIEKAEFLDDPIVPLFS